MRCIISCRICSLRDTASFNGRTIKFHTTPPDLAPSISNAIDCRERCPAKTDRAQSSDRPFCGSELGAATEPFFLRTCVATSAAALAMVRFLRSVSRRSFVLARLCTRLACAATSSISASVIVRYDLPRMVAAMSRRRCSRSSSAIIAMGSPPSSTPSSFISDSFNGSLSPS